MSTPTTDAEQQQDKPCRLCLENITPHGNQTGIDVLKNDDVRKLVQEVYEVQISPGGSSSTMLCMSCYQQLVNDYTFRMNLFTLRKTFKLNQTMLIAQIIAFEGTSEKPPDTKTDRYVPVREKCTQTETPTLPEHCPPTTTTKPSLENGTDDSHVEQPPTIPETAKTAVSKNELVPVLVDCLKDPLYIKALHPLVVSINKDDAAPLMLYCRCCYKIFDSKDKMEQHKTMSCVPSCRFCLSEQTANHSCALQSEYSAIRKHIVGSQKYVTTYAASNAAPESNADESFAIAANDESNEPKTKKMKLDANHNGQDLPFERRPPTPYVWDKTSETEPEIPTTNGDKSRVITLTSSEEESVLKKHDRKSATKNRSKSKKQRK